MAQLRDADVVAVLDTLRSGWLTMGPRIQDFEAAFAAWRGAGEAIAVSSGSAALHLALAARVRPGDEVLVPAVCGGGAAAAARHAGAVPVGCDVVDPALPVIDPADAARRLSPATAAIVAVHPFGLRADVDTLAALGRPVVQDRRGALGLEGAGGDDCFSFADGRVLPMGEGGMVTTADSSLAERVRLLRAHAMTSGTWDRHRGHSASYDVVDIGFNFRLDEPRAALGISRLERIEDDLAARRAQVERWATALGGVPGVRLVADPAGAPDSVALLVEDRVAALGALRDDGIDARAEAHLVVCDVAADPARVATRLAG